MRKDKVIPLALPGRPAHRGGMEPLKNEEHSRFARAYRENHDELLAFVRRRVSSDIEAADIVQESYLGLLRYRHGDDSSALRALLFKIALNQIGMRVRIARTRALADHVPLDGDGVMLVSEDPSCDRQIAGEQRLDRLMAAIEKFPPKCRQAFVLRRFQDMSLREIAQRMNISVKAVERHITTALALLQKKIGSDWP